MSNLLAICQNLDGMITYDVRSPKISQMAHVERSEVKDGNSSKFNRFGTILRKSFTLGHNKKKCKHDSSSDAKSQTLNSKKSSKHKSKPKVIPDVTDEINTDLQEYSVPDFQSIQSGSSKNSLCENSFHPKHNFKHQRSDESYSLTCLQPPQVSRTPTNLSNTNRALSKSTDTKFCPNELLVSEEVVDYLNEVIKSKHKNKHSKMAKSSEHIDCILCDIIGLRGASCKGGLNEGKLQ